MIEDHWYWLEQGMHPAAYNMAMDEALLAAAPELGRPVLRFYRWSEPAASFGYSQHFADIVQWTKLRPLMRRPTGGGLVPHDADWTYSVVVPPNHAWYQFKATESYQRVHEWIRDAFASIKIITTLAPSAIKEIPGQCFVGAEKADVLWHGRKVAGAAQRRTKGGLLIQGSVQPPPIGAERAAWERAMLETTGHQWAVLDISGKLANAVEELVRVKYSRDDYNQRR